MGTDVRMSTISTQRIQRARIKQSSGTSTTMAMEKTELNA